MFAFDAISGVVAEAVSGADLLAGFDMVENARRPVTIDLLDGFDIVQTSPKRKLNRPRTRDLFKDFDLVEDALAPTSEDGSSDMFATFDIVENSPKRKVRKPRTSDDDTLAGFDIVEDNLLVKHQNVSAKRTANVEKAKAKAKEEENERKAREERGRLELQEKEKQKSLKQAAKLKKKEAQMQMEQHAKEARRKKAEAIRLQREEKRREEELARQEEKAKKDAIESERKKRADDKKKREEEEMSVYRTKMREIKALKEQARAQAEEKKRARREAENSAFEERKLAAKAERERRMEEAKRRHQKKLLHKRKEKEEKEETARLAKMRKEEETLKVKLKREESTKAMQARMEEAKKRYDERRLEQAIASVSPQRRPNALYALSPTRQSMPSLKKTESPLREHQKKHKDSIQTASLSSSLSPKKLGKKHKKETKRKKHKPSKEPRPPASIDSIEPTAYAPGKPGPYLTSSKGGSTALPSKNKEDPEIENARIKRRDAAMHRMNKKLLLKDFEEQRQNEVKRLSMRMSMEKAQHEKVTAQARAYEIEVAKKLAEQRKKDARKQVQIIVKQYKEGKEKWADCVRQVLALGMYDDPSWEQIRLEHDNKAEEVYNKYILEKEDKDFLRMSQNAESIKLLRQSQELNKRAVDASFQQFKQKSFLSSVISTFANLYESVLNPETDELIRVQLQPQKDVIGCRYLEHFDCRVKDERWWHVGLTLWEIAQSFNKKYVESSSALKESLQTMKDLRKSSKSLQGKRKSQIAFDEILGEEWIKWTKTCGRRFEQVEISEENAKLMNNCTEDGELVTTLEILDFRRRRVEKKLVKTKQGYEKLTYVISTLSSVERASNNVYHLECLKAWKRIQEGDIPESAFEEYKLSKKGHMKGLSPIKILQKYAAEDIESKNNAVAMIKRSEKKDSEETFQSWAAKKDRLKLRISQEICDTIGGSEIPFKYVGSSKQNAGSNRIEKSMQYMKAGDRVSVPVNNSALQAVANGRKIFWAQKRMGNNEWEDLENSKMFLKRLVSMQKQEMVQGRERMELAEEEFSNFLASVQRVDQARNYLRQLSPKRASNEKMWQNIGRCMLAINTSLAPEWVEWSLQHRRKTPLPGDITIVKGSKIATTSADWTRLLWRGNKIQVNDHEELTVAHTGTFNATEVPLQKAPLRSARGVHAALLGNCTKESCFKMCGKFSRPFRSPRMSEESFERIRRARKFVEAESARAKVLRLSGDDNLADAAIANARTVNEELKEATKVNEVEFFQDVEGTEEFYVPNLDEFGVPVDENARSSSVVMLSKLHYTVQSVRVGDCLKIDKESVHWWEVLSIDIIKKCVRARRSHRVQSLGLGRGLLQIAEHQEQYDYLLDIKEEREIPEWISFNTLEKKRVYVRRMVTPSSEAPEESDTWEEPAKLPVYFRFQPLDPELALQELERYVQEDSLEKRTKEDRERTFAWQKARIWLQKQMREREDFIVDCVQRLHIDRCNDYKTWLRVGKSLYDFENSMNTFRKHAEKQLRKLGEEAKDHEKVDFTRDFGEREITMLRNAFSWYDQTGEGRITWGELCTVLSELKCEFDPSDAVRWIKDHRDVSTSEKNTVGFNEFLDWCSNQAQHFKVKSAWTEQEDSPASELAKKKDEAEAWPVFDSQQSAQGRKLLHAWSLWSMQSDKWKSLAADGFSISEMHSLCAEEWARFDRYRFLKSGEIDVQEAKIEHHHEGSENLPQALTLFDLPADKGAAVACKRMEEDRMNQLDPMTAWSVRSYAMLMTLDSVYSRMKRWKEEDEKKMLKEQRNRLIPKKLIIKNILCHQAQVVWGEEGWFSAPGYSYELFVRSLPKETERGFGGHDFKRYQSVFTGRTERGCTIDALSPCVQYQARLCITTDVGAKKWSSPEYFCASPSPPKELICTRKMFVGKSKGVAVLRWLPGGNDGLQRNYIVQVRGLREDDRGWKIIYKGKSEHCSIIDAPLNKKFHCRVCAVNKAKQWSEWAPSLTITLKASHKVAPIKRLTKEKVLKLGSSRLQKIESKKAEKERLLQANDWVEKWDPVSGHTYYASPSTKQLTLEKPANGKFTSP
jgi:hypothetical protein